MDHFPSSNKAYKLLNSLPNETNLAWSILKAFADNKIYETEKLKFVLGRVENITEKKKMVTAFSPFPIMFSKGSFCTVVTSQNYVVKS